MFKQRLLVVSFLMLAVYFCQAQGVRLSGRILNEKNEPLPGATVNIEGVRQVSSDVEGRFSIVVNPGKYTITVSYVGYATKAVSEIEVAGNQENSLDITMVPASTTEQGVIVRTTRRQESTNALLSFQRNNTALSSGLAADFIRRTPDKNTGEVLKRVSGASIQDNRFVVIRGLSDRYNAAVINNAQFPSTEPDKKAFSFDIIPSILVDNIIINKTATPELTGEFAGGLVQVNTKDVPAKNILSVGISLGFNTQSAFKDFYSNERNSTDWLGFDDGTRSLPAGFPKSAQAYRSLGATNNGILQQLELSKTFNSNVYAEKKSTALPTQQYNITWGNTKKFKNDASFGTILSLIYRKSMLKYNVQRRLNEDDGEVNTQLFDDQNKYSVNAGFLANLTYVKGKHKISFKNLFNQLFEDNYFKRSGQTFDRLQDIDFGASVVNQRSLYSGQLEGDHQLTNGGIKLRWNLNGAYNWKIQPDLRTYSYFSGIGTGDDFELDNDDTRRFDSDLKDFSYGANGTLTIPFKMSNTNQVFKAGGSTLIRIRDFKSRIFRYDPTNLSQFNETLNTLPADRIFAPQNIGMDGFIINEFTNNQDKYFGVSVTNGMFGMFDNKIGDDIRLVWGVRVENFQQFLTTRDVTTKRIIVNTEKWDVLPSVNFTYNLNPQHSIRLSGSRTVSRPEFREIAPFSFFDYEVNYAVNGNPELKRGSILNGDVRYEFYPKGGEAISLGLFYKSFNDPIEFRLNSSSVINRRSYEYQNADKAYSVGGELEIRKGLDFINSSWQNFSVFANLTYILSEVTLLSTSGSGAAETSNRPLQGQSPYLVNVGLQYNGGDNGVNGSLLYNRIGQRLALVGISNLGFPDVYERPRDQLDFQIGKRILKNKGEIKLTWADLLNPEYYFYENTNNKSGYKSNVDRLFYSYKPGSTISLGFTYDFNL